MKFDVPLEPGILLKRYKRFLADVQFSDGRVETVHCPNTGAMTGCAIPGIEAWCSSSNKPGRKYRYTLEVVRVEGCFIGVNSSRANAVVGEALAGGSLPPFLDYRTVLREIKSPDSEARFDFLLRRATKPDCYVEVKSMTMRGKDNVGLFPDSRSTRATRHVEALVRARHMGYRAALIFCVQHAGIRQAAIAAEIDPVYGRAVQHACDEGVEIYAWRAAVDITGINLSQSLPVVLSASV
jgi:sugar fermentation stimulation protein A